MLDYFDLVKIALTSGASASLITFLANYYLKKQDYKRDYYKKITDKRISAYEELENIISEFRYTKKYENCSKESKYYHSCIDTLNKRQDIINQIRSCLKRKIWLSRSMGVKLSMLYLILMDCNEKDESAYQNKLVDKYERITRITFGMRKILIEDLLKLYDIEHFLKQPKHKKGLFKSFK
jgi:hypothetical protein